ncbi:glycoside hydrolase family 3 N-terminal domain-containing protein [Flavobacteriaceae bacterium M23B6Z8]
MKSSLFAIFLLFSLNMYNLNAQDLPPYKNKNLAVEERVKDLLQRMTLEEKMNQMLSVNNEVKDSIEVNPDGSFTINKIKPMLQQGIGQITRLTETSGGQSQTASGGSNKAELSPAQNAVLANMIQRFFIEETRLGIPVIFHEECLHGLVAKDATSFPHPIALASMFNAELATEIYTAIAEETRARGGHQALTPVVDVARDPRWGRVEETFGEDPFLITQMGLAAVKGFQGDASFKNKKHIIATLKHFAAHGHPEGGTNTAPANYSERILREIHFYPFEQIIKKANALSIMTTYHELDGIPVNAHKKLVTDMLRNEWGFKGFVVSDYFSIREMNERYGVNTHRVAKNGKEAALLALKAGVNIELPNPDCYKHIPELVTTGKIPEAQIDTLVAEMLRIKFKMGLFDDPYIDESRAKNLTGFAADRKSLARKAAQQSIVLLENKNDQLPLSLTSIKSIAVIGPNANRANVGGYTGSQPYQVSVLEGIQNRVGSEIDVKYAEGCKITIGGSWVEDKVTLPTEAEDTKLIEEAVAIASQSDVIVLVLGGNEQTSREAWNNFHMGDRTNLQLFGRQDALINALHKTGKPIIGVVFNGRPLAFTNLIEKASGVLECWYLGQESGNAVADVLFGGFNPGGKLPISFPRSVGHIPAYYNHKPSARRGYLKDDISALYTFGYGLSYCTFELSAPILDRSQISKDESVTVSVTVRNTGKYSGSETVQLYIRDDWSSVTRPVKELKGFKRVFLDPGESTQVSFEITPEALSFYDIDMKYIVEAGTFTVMTGSSSQDSDLQKTTLTVE